MKKRSTFLRMCFTDSRIVGVYNISVLLFFLIFESVCLISCSREDRSTRNSVTDSKQEIENKQEDSSEVDVKPSNEDKEKSHDEEKPQTIHVFIENSGSMNGYINADSDFQMAIGRVIQLMKGYYKNIRVYYINQTAKEQDPKGEDIYKFVKKMLEKREFTTSGTGKKDTDTDSTDLNQILSRVLQDVDSDNTAILISDFIYSLSSTNGVTKSLLYDCQNLTMSAVWSKVKDLNGLLAANIIQLYSNFNGNYWSWEHPTGLKYAINLENCSRPYYIGVFGTDANVRYFNEKISVSELAGYKNQYTLSSRDVSDSKWTVMPTYSKKGIQFRYDKSSVIQSIKNVKKLSRDSYNLSVCIDLSHFLIPEFEPASFKVYDDNHEIESVQKLDQITLSHPADKDLAEKNQCTHVVVLKSEDNIPRNFSFGIERTIPKWIEASSSDDDKEIKDNKTEQSKTFGIKYFVNGISDAYRQYANDNGKNKDNLITFTIEIEKR
ncbi:hypothetical protein J5690_07195 [bacterium]|nr:hypothetical protein [bacterium]